MNFVHSCIWQLFLKNKRWDQMRVWKQRFFTPFCSLSFISMTQWAHWFASRSVCNVHSAELIYCLQASKRNCISKQRADWVHPWRVVGNVNRWHDYRRLTGALQSASWSDRKRAQVSCSWRSAAHTQGIIHQYFYHMPSWAVIGDVGGWAYAPPNSHICQNSISGQRTFITCTLDIMRICWSAGA